MREIKFRAWDKRYRAMFYFNFLSCHSTIESVITKTESDEPVHIMQYTGLKDKNNKDIYESDIVVCRSMHDGNVFGHAWRLENGNSIANPIEIHKNEDGIDWQWFDDIRCDPTNWEVIGNIYENPELLK